MSWFQKIAIAILSALVLLLAWVIYIRSIPNVSYVLTNASNEIVSVAEIIVKRPNYDPFAIMREGRHSSTHTVVRYEFYQLGQIKPGEHSEISLATHSEASPDIRIRFLSGKELFLNEPVYVDSWFNMTARFEIKDDKIVLIDTTYR